MQSPRWSVGNAVPSARAPARGSRRERQSGAGRPAAHDAAREGGEAVGAFCGPPSETPSRHSVSSGQDLQRPCRFAGQDAQALRRVQPRSDERPSQEAVGSWRRAAGWAGPEPAGYVADGELRLRLRSTSWTARAPIGPPGLVLRGVAPRDREAGDDERPVDLTIAGTPAKALDVGQEPHHGTDRYVPEKLEQHQASPCRNDVFAKRADAMLAQIASPRSSEPESVASVAAPACG